MLSLAAANVGFVILKLPAAAPGRLFAFASLFVSFARRA
ncbi:hypothetical protein [Klebsiella pneumoniae IS53]|nr:hypothetical protein [Klebsiella pneumoniae IS53]